MDRGACRRAVVAASLDEARGRALEPHLSVGGLERTARGDQAPAAGRAATQGARHGPRVGADQRASGHAGSGTEGAWLLRGYVDHRRTLLCDGPCGGPTTL